MTTPVVARSRARSRWVSLGSWRACVLGLMAGVVVVCVGSAVMHVTGISDGARVFGDLIFIVPLALVATQSGGCVRGSRGGFTVAVMTLGVVASVLLGPVVEGAIRSLFT